MKFTINREHFANGLSEVLHVVGLKCAMPIMSNVLIEGVEDCIVLTATNLDVVVRCKIPANVAEVGAVTLPARRLAAIVKELPNIDVRMEVSKGSRVKLTSGCSAFKISGIEKGEFPPIEAFEGSDTFVLDQAELLEMLHSVSFAQSTDETRYILNAVYFKLAKGKLSLVATDGRRLAVYTKAVDVPGAFSFLLPASSVDELERHLGKGSKITAALHGSRVAFFIDTDKDADGFKDAIYFCSKLTAGAYPNYEQVIPREDYHSVTIEREVLLEAIARAALVTSAKTLSVKLHFRKGNLEITAQGVDVGDAHESVDITYDGPEAEVAFNPGFLCAPLAALKKDEVRFEFKDGTAPGVFRTKDGFVCVVMPVRIS